MLLPVFRRLVVTYAHFEAALCFNLNIYIIITLLQYEIVTVSADGVEVVGPLVGKSDWTIASYVR